MGKILASLTLTTRLAGLLVLAGFWPAARTFAADGAAPRLQQPLAEAWSFRYGGNDAVAALAGDTAAWPMVRLPHTWNAADGADGGGDYARGTGWYVRRFRLDPAWAGRRVYVQFDGANRTATVFLNGRELGTHAGGFARFRFDLTDALKPDGENILAVRVDNSADGLAPVSADFTFFGGIYRDVTLLALDPLHIDVMDHGANGVFVTPGAVSAAQAEFSVAVNVRNESDRAERTVVRTEVRDAAGAVVAAKEETWEIAAGGFARSTQAFSLAQPHLWNGRADPYQYTADVTVLADGRVHDRLPQRFGLRYFTVEADKGFFLNGTHLGLHGVSRHQDRAGKGWAISPADDREDFALIEEIGATALRVAHYPQSPLWFDLADEHGLVVWAEIPVVNEVPASARYTENAREQLRELIRQNYNRPAICFWGVGNETREGDEPAGKPAQPNGRASDRLIADLAALVHTEDPTRLSTYASHHKGEDARNFHTDVMAFNKYFGWYGGKMDDLAKWVDDVHARFPHLRFGLSEYGAGANIRQHDSSGTKPQATGAFHPEEYQARLHEVQWAALQARPFIWGTFAWNMFDFAADQRNEGGAPGLNDKGLVTYDRKTKKDAFFWYQANWSTAPVLHITSQRFSPRPAGPVELKVYSNAPQVELLLNGTSCGTMTSDTHIFRWNVTLHEGENAVAVRAPDGGTTLADNCTFLCPTPTAK